MRILKLLSVLFFYSSLFFAQDVVNRIEPPFWWVGMQNPEVQLMLHGNNISEYVPSINYDGVTISGVEKTENKNYLFITLKIQPETKQGVLRITLQKADDKITIYYEIKDRIQHTNLPTINSSDIIYLITPDRFANGDKSNDSIPGYFEKADRSDVKYRHGGDIAGIKSKLNFIKDLGFTAIWSMPLLQSNMPIYSYHGYSITDHYNIDRRYGTNEEYLDLIKESHKLGLKVIKDMVFNQFGEGHYWTKDMPSKEWVHNWDKFTYSNFDGTVIPDIHSSSYDRDHFNKGWFDKWMPDLNQENKLVSNYLIQNTIWWVEYAGLDGIRMDTYQYNYKECMNEWLKRIKAEFPNLFIVGEVWMNYPEIIAYWKKGTVNQDGFKSELESITDFPIHASLNQVFTDYRPIYELYKVISRDYLYTNANTNLIFADNHDVTRLFTFVKEDIQKYKQVLAFLFTTRGIPQIYYGTEILMTGDHHEVLRADYPGGWTEDTVNAFISSGRTALQNEAFDYLSKLANWRKNESVIHNGKLMHFIPYNDLYVYFRYDDNKTIMVAINKGKADVNLDFNRHKEMLKNHSSGKDVITGKIYSDLNNIVVKTGSALILELK